MCYYFTRGVIMNENNFELGNYLKRLEMNMELLLEV